MKNPFLLLTILSLVSCASVLTKDDMTFSYVEKTEVSGKVGYNGLISYLATNLNDSNTAIKVKDNEALKVISQVGFPCNDVQTSMLDINQYTTIYAVEADFKDNKVKLSISGYMQTARVPLTGQMGPLSPFQSYQKEGVKKCADKLKDMLLTAINSSKQAEW